MRQSFFLEPSLYQAPNGATQSQRLPGAALGFLSGADESADGRVVKRVPYDFADRAIVVPHQLAPL